MNLLRWFFPLLMPQISGGGGGGDSGAQAQADEARKQTLRSKIDALYGVNTPGPVQEVVNGGSGWFKGIGPATQQKHDADLAANATDSSQADDARTQMDAERGQVSDATRSYYNDQLARSFGAAARNNRFNLARQSQLGGSVDVDSNAELQTDQALGATRIDQAARGAAAQLDAQREQERMNAISLVNSGAGESAVASAQAGLKNSLSNVSSQQRTNLFSDLFANGADAFTTANVNSANAAMLARYFTPGTAFFPSRASGGAVTPSG